MSLVDVRHQAAAHRRIQRAISSERMPHAYIFHGPDGVGKESFARGLAELLLCERPIEASPPESDANGLTTIRQGCERCTECRLIASDSHPDFHLVTRQLHRNHPDLDVRKRKGLDLSVDVIRHFVIDKVALTPNRSRAKVFVIRQAELMNVQAQNALLKTLEEPPGTTFLILLTDALDALLSTTRSRCQVVPFGGLPLDFIRSKLSSFHPNRGAEELDWCSRIGEASMGKALEAVEDELFALHARLERTLGDGQGAGPTGAMKAWKESAEALAERYRKRDPEITDADADRRGYLTILRLLAFRYADLLRTAVRQQPDEADAISEIVERIALAERQLDHNVHPQLCLETLAYDLLESEKRQAPVTYRGG